MMELARCFSDVIIIDLTYKTNRYKMPLCHFAHVTSSNTFFFAGFCFMSGEAEGDYIFAVNAYKTLIRGDNLKDLDVALTDYCPALKHALYNVFPGVQQMLCMFHINAAVHGRIEEL